jgi:hypothetical protein
VKETSHTTFDELLNAFELDEVQKRILIELIQTFPLFMIIFVSPFIGKHHRDMEESVSYDVAPIAFYKAYFELYHVPVERSNDKDLKLFCGIYKNYIKSIDEISRSSDWKIRLERLSAHFPEFFRFKEIERDGWIDSIESSVSSYADLLLLFPNEPITIDDEAKKCYRDRIEYFTEQFLGNESVTLSGTALQFSNSKLDGTLEVSVGRQRRENTLGSVHVQYRAGIGLEEDLGDFSEILHLDSDITRGQGDY